MPDIDIDVLPLLPLTTGVVLPGMVVTLTLESDEARAAAEAASDTAERTMLLVPKVDGRYARVGTIAKIEDLGQTRSGVEALVIRGLTRAVVGVGVPGTGEALWVQAEPVEEPEPTARAKELAREYRAVVENIVESRGVPQVAEFLRGIADPGQIADTAGYSPDLSFEQKIEVLETVDVEARLELVVGWAKDTLADLELKDKIRTDVSEGMEKRQREFLLREQMSAIRKELGEDGEEDVVERVPHRRSPTPACPPTSWSRPRRELGRLERMSEQSPEYGWIRTYLDWMIDVPWNVRTEDNLEITEARAVLDADHEGLQDVKDRILEYLAVRKLRAERGLGEATGRGSGAILTLVGPPGVGKTSLGESVARALGREVRARVAGRHPRRGRDPRAPAHLRRRAARPHRPRAEGRRYEEPGDDARRDRQGRRRLARRPLERAARGARPGAEPHVPRSLPRRRPRPVRGAVHHHGQRRRDDPRAAVRPDGSDPDRRLHRGGEGRDRQAPPGGAPARAQRPA